MPYIRGIVFSSVILDGCDGLRDQLQLLLWGGLHLAVVKTEAGDVATASPASCYGCDSLAVLQLPPPQTAAAEEGWGATEGGDAAVAVVSRWSAGLGLHWPEEVLVLGTAEVGDGAGALRRHLQLQQQQVSTAEGVQGGRASGDALPGFTLESLEEARAAPWQRLRLALAHANLCRAEAEAEAGRQAGAERCGLAGSHPPPFPPPAALLVVGTAMKPSRERDLAREGLLNLVPRDGVVFAPLDLSMPLEQQLPFHVILHKASDELEYHESGAPRFGPRVSALANFVARDPGISLVDPLEATAKVINRTELAAVCDSLSRLDMDLDLDAGAGPAAPVESVSPAAAAAPALRGSDGGGSQAAAVAAVEGSGSRDGEDEGAIAPSRMKRRRVGQAPAAVMPGARVRVRAPRSTTVSSFAPEEVEAARTRLGCPPPYIVKPVVACGTADSHRMALVLLPEGLEELQGVPLPAVVQEFVNHDATIFKVYVAGDKVFHTVRSSIPNVPRDRDQALRLAPAGRLLFDSLKSLPTSLGLPKGAGAGAAAGQRLTGRVRSPCQAVLERLAAHLRAKLGLSLFGFDVVIAAAGSSGSCDVAGACDGAAADGAADAGSCGDDGRDSSGYGSGGGGREPHEEPPHRSANAAAPRGEQHQEAEAATAAAVEEEEEEEGEGEELVVVDVNYFPSYKGAEGAPALFRAAVLAAHRRQRQPEQPKQ